MNANYFEVGSMGACGIFRMHKEIDSTSYGFNCLIPSSVKEEDVGEYIAAMLDSIKDEVMERKTWRFREKKGKKKEEEKPKYRKRASGGQKLKPLLDKALKGKQR